MKILTWRSLFVVASLSVVPLLAACTGNAPPPRATNPQVEGATGSTVVPGNESTPAGIQPHTQRQQIQSK